MTRQLKGDIFADANCKRVMTNDDKGERVNFLEARVAPVVATIQRSIENRKDNPYVASRGREFVGSICVCCPSYDNCAIVKATIDNVPTHLLSVGDLPR